MTTKSTTKPFLKVIVADDHPMFRNGLAATIKNIPGVSEVSKAQDGEEVLRLLKAGKFNLVFLDVKMPGALPITMSAVVLMTVAVVAAMLPAVRAARVDVMEALRYE